MWITISLVVFYLFTPLLLIYLTRISKILNRIGSVVLAYLFGLIMGNTGILPEGSAGFRQFLRERASMPTSEFEELLKMSKVTATDYTVNQIAGLQNNLMTIIILIAIPLLVFSLDLKKWLKLAKSALLSLALALFSLMLVIFVGYYMFGPQINESDKVAGMLVGVYTGGTANLAAIGTALHVNANTFLLVHTSDLIVGSVALLFLMTFAQNVFHVFLPRFQVLFKAENKMHLNDEHKENEDIENFEPLFKREYFPDLLKSIGISIAIAAIGGGLSLFFEPPTDTTVAILSITTLGLLASFIKPVNKLQNSFQFGMYLIIVFSLVVSSMANLSNMLRPENQQIFYYVAFVVIGSIVIHVALAGIFKIDADTTIISITALTYSPPFVPTVAGALKNKDVIITGLTIGILGYAFGTYLGIIIDSILR